MPGGIEIRFGSGDEGKSVKAVGDRLEKAAAEIRAGMENPHSRISTFLDQWVQDNFKSEGGNVPDGWAPFAFGGRFVERADGSTFIDTTAKLLQDTGRLRASFIPFASKDEAGIGSKVPYSKKHERGQGAFLPARPMLPRLDWPAGRVKAKTVRERIRQIFSDHVIEIAERNRMKVEGGDSSLSGAFDD